MTLYVFDPNNLSPKRITSGPGIGFIETGDSITILYTGIANGITGSIQGAGIANQLAIWNAPVSITGSIFLTTNGLDLTVLSGSIIIGDVNLFRHSSDMLRSNDALTLDKGLNVGIASGTALEIQNKIFLGGFGAATGTAEFSMFSNGGNAANNPLPIVSIIARNHDAGGIFFDAKFYTSGSNLYISGDSFTNFGIIKSSGALTVVINTGTAVGGGFNFSTIAEYTSRGQYKISRGNINAGLVIEDDTQLYRNVANVLRTPDSLLVDIGLGVGTTNLISAGNISPTGYITGTNYFEGSYTPYWSGTQSGTVLGNGAIYGRFQRIGRFCNVQIQLDIGTTTQKGTGVWEFGLPSQVTPQTGTSRFAVGSAQILDAGVADFLGVARLDKNTGKIRVLTKTGTIASTANTIYPMVWANGDSLVLNLSYEAQ